MRALNVSARAIRLCVDRLVLVFSGEVVFHVEPLFVASEKSGAGTNHVGSEGELLAVEHESVSVIIYFVLHVLALVLEHGALSHEE
jgi:hypothetical protein